MCDSHLWKDFLSSIFKTEIIIIRDYETETKHIGELYKKFKNEYKLPINFFETIKECKFFNFYYNQEERNKYLNIWSNKLCELFIPFSESEYKFYINLCFENQYINDIKTEHYIDNGCFCELCNDKRKEIHSKAKNGEIKFEKICHKKLVMNKQEKNIQTIIKNNNNTKFINNQFKINLFL